MSFSIQKKQFIVVVFKNIYTVVQYFNECFQAIACHVLFKAINDVCAHFLLKLLFRVSDHYSVTVMTKLGAYRHLLKYFHVEWIRIALYPLPGHFVSDILLGAMFLRLFFDTRQHFKRAT